MLLILLNVVTHKPVKGYRYVQTPPVHVYTSCYIFYFCWN